MDKQTKQAGILAFAILAVAVAPAKGSVTLVKSRAAMDGNDLINWAQLGKSLTIVNSPADVTSNGGLSATVNNLGGSTLGKERQGDPDPGVIAINNVTLAVPAGCETNRK
jgi:hypothetical protein